MNLLNILEKLKNLPTIIKALANLRYAFLFEGHVTIVPFRSNLILLNMSDKFEAFDITISEYLLSVDKIVISGLA